MLLLMNMKYSSLHIPCSSTEQIKYPMRRKESDFIFVLKYIRLI